MPPLKFYSDLAEAQSIIIDGVSDVRRGDDPGAIKFTYQHSQLADAAIVQMISHDCMAYPKNVEFLVFSEFDRTDSDLALCLDGVCARRKWTSITEAIQVISAVITAAIEKRESGSSEDEEESPWDDQSQFEELDPMEISSPDAADQPEENQDISDLVCRCDTQYLLDLKNSLKKAQASGIIVGIYPRRGSNLPEVISLSAPVACLGVPAGVLEAWGLKESDNLVLLIRMGYLPSLSEFLRLSSRQTTVHFRFGKCRGEKPSLASVQSAYGDTRISSEARNQKKSTGGADTKLSFELINMSNSLDRLLNSDFMKLLDIRRNSHVSWEKAQYCLSQLESLTSTDDPALAEMNFDIRNAQVDQPPLQYLVAPFSRDNAHDTPDVFSIPLVAMQLALHRIANCTRYCMVCNARLVQNVQALKAYVCDNSLCLFQYLSLGLGSSIEHEIINAPYVVDMLVSFLYSALANSTARELPDGLHIKTAYVDDAWAEKGYATATADMVAMTMRNVDFSNAPTVSDTSLLKEALREGDRVIIIHRESLKAPSTNDLVVKSWCRLISCIDREWKFERFHTVEVHGSRLPDSIKSPNGEPLSRQPDESSGLFNVKVFGYWQNIDELDVEKRRSALLTILDGLPSVLEMRQYLMLQPGRRLATWSRMNASELSVLNWTVASNRSMIIQDDAVPNPEMPENAKQPWTKVDFFPTQTDQWMQFRFVQGSPVSEQAFEREVTTLMQTTRTPTVFAWHGSHLKNWHSIIRTGLDFSAVENGRACGNGVYFSSDMNTSLGYSSGAGRVARGIPVNMVTNWSKSQLQISSAIAICELINRTGEYVSQTPHFVVDMLDWIQCRYLLVNVNPSEEARQFPFYEPRINQTPGYMLQDSQFRICAGSPRKVVQIPITAVPHTRRQIHRATPQGSARLPGGPLPIHRTEQQSGAVSYPQMQVLTSEYAPTGNLINTEDAALRRESTPQQPPEQLTYAADDVEFYLSVKKMDVTASYSAGMKRLNSSTSESSIVSQYSNKRARTVSDASAAATIPTTEEQSGTSAFDPARLKMDSLRILQTPAWATTSRQAIRRLAMDMKALHQRQTSEGDLSSGYYVHTESLENMFQWVVELFDFDESLPLARDMAQFNCPSVVLEFRFGPSYPMSPPFVRVIRPQFVPFAHGGGGHITAGGAICLELLTNSGWNPAINIDNVICQIRAAISEPDPAARIQGNLVGVDYSVGEAVRAFTRLASAHGWQVPEDFKQLASLG